MKCRFAIWRFQIERYAFFVRVPALEIQAVVLAQEIRASRPSSVSSHRRIFDLDHPAPRSAKQRRCDAPRTKLFHREYAHTLERTGVFLIGQGGGISMYSQCCFSWQAVLSPSIDTSALNVCPDILGVENRHGQVPVGLTSLLRASRCLPGPL